MTLLKKIFFFSIVFILLPALSVACSDDDDNIGNGGEAVKVEKRDDMRIFDKVTMTTGVIELKCPNCHRVVEVDLSLRKGTVKYRLTRSNNRANN